MVMHARCVLRARSSRKRRCARGPASCHFGPQSLFRGHLLVQAQQAAHALCAIGEAGMQPSGRDSNRNPFHFPFGLNSSLNFVDSYLSVQSSKNHETGSVGFINLSSTQKKY
jgi:hypothetical protein